MRVIIDGTAEDGTRIKVEKRPGLVGVGPPNEPFRVWVNDEEVPVTGRCTLYRDGGTVGITVAAGRIVKRNRLQGGILDKDTRSFFTPPNDEQQLIEDNHA